jgi:hypothetical protein
MRYPIRASELDHRRLQVSPSPLQDPSPKHLHAAKREEGEAAPWLLDSGHQRKLTELLQRGERAKSANS